MREVNVSVYVCERETGRNKGRARNGRIRAHALADKIGGMAKKKKCLRKLLWMLFHRRSVACRRIENADKRCIYREKKKIWKEQIFWRKHVSLPGTESQWLCFTFSAANDARRRVSFTCVTLMILLYIILFHWDGEQMAKKKERKK